jgi:uncharacterized protein (TIGR00645 family)
MSKKTPVFCARILPITHHPSPITHHSIASMEKLIEKTLFGSRWLLAPVYLGLSLALVALGIKFFQELYIVFLHLFDAGFKETDLVLHLLALIDMALVGSLIVMVTFSSYENFVSRIDVEGDSDKLSWLGKLDASSLKLKVAASIVAISSIHLLKMFMNLQSYNDMHLLWGVIIHLTFVVSAVMMGVLDRMSAATHRQH